MKRLIDPVPAGGAPINNEELNLLFQTEIYDSIQAMLSRWDSDSQGIIVKGCLITGTTGNYAISEGIVYLNGKFMRLPAATGQALPKYIAPKAVSYLTRQFSDGVTRNMIEVVEAELVSAAPGSGQYVAITSSTDPDDRRLSTLLTFVNTLTSTATYQGLTAAQGKTLKDLVDGLTTDKVAKAGDTMTGNLSIPDGTDAAHAVSKSQLDLKAPINNPTFTGAPAAPTPAQGDNTTKIATTAYVDADRYVSPAAGTSAAVGDTTILTIPAPADKAITISAEMAAYSTAGTVPVGSSAGGVKIATFKNVAGVVSQIGATSVVHGAVHDTNSPVLKFTISGTNVLVQVNMASGSDTYRVRCKAKVITA